MIRTSKHTNQQRRLLGICRNGQHRATRNSHHQGVYLVICMTRPPFIPILVMQSIFPNPDLNFRILSRRESNKTFPFFTLMTPSIAFIIVTL